MNTPLEALERLKELRPLLLKVECSSEPSDWSGIRTVTTNWYRNPEGREAVAIIDALLSSYEAQGERLREVEDDAEADRAFNLEALRQIKAAIEYGDNPAILIETAIRMASIAVVRDRNAARSALTRPPAMDGGQP